jgi:hypothetical protein
MNFLFKEYQFFKRKISVAVLLWLSLAIIAVIVEVVKNVFNNYLIYKGVFWHTIYQTNLFNLYPAEYFDCNHYGPFFSIIIAPFALLPDKIGCLLWGIFNAVFLFFAIKKLPIEDNGKNILFLITALELMTSQHNVQFNPILTGTIILSYVFVHQKKEIWATLFIAIGIMTKIYGVVGLAFFMFSEDKIKFIWTFIMWMILLFILPMVISSPHFIIQSYQDWYQSLIEKNDSNQESAMQGMTAMRFVKKAFAIPSLNDVFFIVGAGMVYLISIFRINQLKEINFQISYLASLLIGLVIFSSSAESPTYIIAMMGVGMWYVIQERKTKSSYFILFLAMVFTSLSTTDFFPKTIKADFIRPYAVKAMPCFIVWLVLSYQLIFKKFNFKNH